MVQLEVGKTVASEIVFLTSKKEVCHGENK